jgi:hypothetical protein
MARKKPQSPDAGQVVIGLNAVILTVADDAPRVLTVRRAGHALATDAQRAKEGDLQTVALPFGPFDPQRHRTIEEGLRGWVTEQTGIEVGYAEQLYTFGNRYRDPLELAGGPRVVSVGYMGLVPDTRLSGTGEAAWTDVYRFFPWEDRRGGAPTLLNDLRARLALWVKSAPDTPARHHRRDRVAQTFGGDGAPWDAVRVLERYELLYEAGLAAEAGRDTLLRAGKTPQVEQNPYGVPMAFDHRRILATALGRVRGKLTYRPVVFELVPPQFTLLQLQRVAEALSGVALHKQNFRRLVVTGGLVEETGTYAPQGRGRPAELYSFRRDVLREATRPGLGLALSK